MDFRLPGGACGEPEARHGNNPQYPPGVELIALMGEIQFIENRGSAPPRRPKNKKRDP